jgi:hypothetical protein
MYIGPWQEYKLAQVIRVKNDIYEGKGTLPSPRSSNAHDSGHNSLHKSRLTTPSTRSFSSEPAQKPYPTFDIDTYYKQWRRVENLISNTNPNNKKPPLPKPLIRKRQGRSIQEKRVNKMRILYGIDNKNDNPITTPIILQENERKSFPDKIRDEVKKSVLYNSVDKAIESTVNQTKNDSKPITPDQNLYKNKEELKDIEISNMLSNKTTKINNRNPNSNVEINEKSCEAQEKSKKDWVLQINPVSDTKDTKTVQYSPEKNNKFNSISKNEDLEVIEESLNQENIDGLLQWVENLPEELSGSPMMNSKGFVL